MSMSVLIANDRNLFHQYQNRLSEINNGGIDGKDIQALKEIFDKYSGIEMILVASSKSTDHLVQVIKLGENGCLSKRMDVSRLLEWIEKCIQQDCIEFQREDNLYGKEVVGILTNREQEVLKLIAVGRSNAEIAEELAISFNTVKSHLRRIFGKLHLKNRTEAARYALLNGYVLSHIDEICM